MTDAHCHVSAGDPEVRELLIGRDFFGTHPWSAATVDLAAEVAALRAALTARPAAGVGEIGLDRLREREISPAMRELFERQLDLAAELQRPVVLHGAKCWGQVLAAISRLPQRPPAFLCHGFSRSDGLLPDIERLGGFVSVGPAVLNDHAVNYRELVRKLPAKCLLLETDRTAENAAECPPLGDILVKVAELRSMSAEALAALTDANASRFFPKEV